MVTSQGSSELILRHNDSQLLKFACSEWNNERMTMNYVIFYGFSALCRIRAFYYRFSDGRNGLLPVREGKPIFPLRSVNMASNSPAVNRLEGQ